MMKIKKMVLAILATSFLVTSIANVKVYAKSDKGRIPGYNVVFVMDTSASMQYSDPEYLTK